MWCECVSGHVDVCVVCVCGGDSPVGDMGQ